MKTTFLSLDYSHHFACEGTLTQTFPPNIRGPLITTAQYSVEMFSPPYCSENLPALSKIGTILHLGNDIDSLPSLGRHLF